jgi:large subunit ribosomal protein L25
VRLAVQPQGSVPPLENIMEIVKLDAKVRSEAGKGPARRLRREGMVPAVAYGRELSAVSIAVSPKVLVDILNSAHGQNTLLELGIDGQKKATVILRDYAVHPVTREILHADFVEIRLDQPVDVDVPLVCLGKAAGVVAGGIMRQIYRRLPVRCLPEKIPTLIEYDVTALELGDNIKVSQLALPEGVTVRLAPEQTVLGVIAPEQEKEEETAAAVAGEAGAVEGAPGAAGAEGAAAAPGAAAAAPAAGAAAAPAKEEKEKKPGKEKKK